MSALLLWLSGPVSAQSPQSVLQAMLDNGVSNNQLAPAFRAQVDARAVQNILDQIRAVTGKPRAITLAKDRFVIETATHQVPGRIALDSEGLVAMLFFEPPIKLAATLPEALAAFEGLAQDIAWLVLRDGASLAERRASEPQAVGSAFKLGVLSVLLDDISGGTRRWDEVVTLKAHHLSHPTGQLQTMPPGAPLTLHTLAALMISISDNTATDVLIDTLGRDRIARALNLPDLLTTREFFALKLSPRAQADWLAADPGVRPALAEQAARTLPPLGAFSSFSPGLEWHVPLETLCALIQPMLGQPILAINPGLARPEDWREIAYKGGSETGVLTMTTALRDDRDGVLCVAVSLNHPGPIDEAAAFSAYRGLLAVLR